MTEVITDYISFLFNTQAMFTDVKVFGDMELYTDPKNFLGRNIREVLPAHVASVTIDALDKCVGNGQPQEFDYELTGHKFHADMAVTVKDGQVIGVRTIITKKQ